MKSILHKKEDHTCFLCMILKEDESKKPVLHEHHVFYGTSNRKNSEKYGLKVYLCPPHHNMSRDSAHFNKDYDEILKTVAQKTFEKDHTREEFISIFGKNYLPEGME